jgi:hypothetical protein
VKNVVTWSYHVLPVRESDGVIAHDASDGFAGRGKTSLAAAAPSIAGFVFSGRLVQKDVARDGSIIVVFGRKPALWKKEARAKHVLHGQKSDLHSRPGDQDEAGGRRVGKRRCFNEQ